MRYWKNATSNDWRVSGLEKTEERMPSMGILQLQEGEKKFQLSRFPPSAELSPFVMHYWIVSWQLENQEPFCQDVIPNPCVNLIVETDRSGIYGVSSSKYTKRLHGNGRVFGVKFRPGGFYPFLNKPVADLTDQSIAIASVFRQGDGRLKQALLSGQPPDALIELAEELLKQELPDCDDHIETIRSIIDTVRDNKEITKVEPLCEAFGFNIRKLQRLFNQYVGVSPKWVIQLYRLQNAAETLDRSHSPDWPRLALELGYYDQSHFIKDFKSIIGKTPDQYIQSSFTNKA